jgi:ABC-type Fe3+/spermidine/putrescine transport system ATPase subunit
MTMSDRVAVFHNGKLEQVGSPLEVYNRPSNRFVGEFIGDSNFFAGRFDPARPDRVELSEIGPMRVQPRNAAAPAGAVDVMIRPERLRLGEAGAPDDAVNRFAMAVDEVINYGDSILVIGTTQGLPLRARLVGQAAEALRRGMTVTMCWAPRDAHILQKAANSE